MAPGGSRAIAGPSVETSHGRVEGLREEGLSVFRGIPYARPPTGARRFRPPEPPDPWPGVRPAHAVGPAAPQPVGMTARLLGAEGTACDEDCLRLNVWTPAAGGGRRPVLVWFHGGGFTTGSGGWAVYDAARLARRGDALVVTFNYRLGALGFLPLDALIRLPEDAAGNLGLRDQIAALRWVRDNAAAFGGDPDDVTLFGGSAGAMSIGALLGAPSARGLFRRAILQSGSPDYVHDGEDAARVSAAFLGALGLAAGDAAALRELPVAQLLAAQQSASATLARVLPRLAFQPAVDGDLLPRPPLEAVREGAGARVPLLVGTNLDEWKFYGLADPRARDLDEARLLRRFERGLPGRDAAGRPLARRVIETYREARAGCASTQPRELWFAIQSDRWFRHPAMRLAEWQAAHQSATYAYLFDWPSPVLGGALGSCHSLEVPFVFGCTDHERLRPVVGEGPELEPLSRCMQDAWLAFARTGDPSHPGVGDWPAYDAARRATLRLGRERRVELAPLEVERSFWDAIA